MKLGELPRHPHFPMLLSELRILLDNHRRNVVTEASRAEDKVVRVAAGKCQGIELILDTLTEVRRKNKE